MFQEQAIKDEETVMVAFYGFLVCRVFLVLNVSVFKYEDIF